MEKEFAFKLGDKVWLMHNNGIVCGSIAKMFYVKSLSRVDCHTVTDNEQYHVTMDGKSIGDFDKNLLFRSKEDLLKSL